MKVPFSWLKKYVEIDLPSSEIAHRLTMAGNEVGEIEEIGAGWDKDKVIVGEIVGIDPHPDADRLRLPTVNIGDGTEIKVVCGAPNLLVGQKIVFAKEGSILFNPRNGKMEKLKPANIRGVESRGMVCSTLELGLGEDHDGILVLDSEAPVGLSLTEYMGDSILDIEVTPNRPDALSVLGIAREVGALTAKSVREPDMSYVEDGPNVSELASVHIENPQSCSRYTASIIRDVRVGPSPVWLRDALIKSGLRPINNIVDITNYVMLEWGQPLHAFDFNRIKSNKIIVRDANIGERLKSLDGVEHELAPPILVIADVEKSIGLAGVMGGANTEIDSDTTTVFLESANFSASNTRKTRSSLGIDSEAAYRFERGIRPELAELALRRATRLISQLADGKPAQAIIDIYPGKQEPINVSVSKRRINQLLGVQYSVMEIERVLISLGFRRLQEPSGLLDMMDTFSGVTVGDQDDVMWFEPPFWRSDIRIEEDVIEELARIIGYDSIPTVMLSTSIPHRQIDYYASLREKCRDILVSCGMQESISYSLVSSTTLKKLGTIESDKSQLRISNPLSSEHEFLRTTLRANILDTLSANRKVNQNEGIRLFEIGKVFMTKPETKSLDLPEEKEVMIGLLSGPRFPMSWTAPTGNMGFFDAKGVIENLSRKTGVDLQYEVTENEDMFQSGKVARILSNDVLVGTIGEVSEPILQKFEVEGFPIALFEIDLNAFLDVSKSSPNTYKSASRYPESYRDLGLLVDADVASSHVEYIIRRHKMVADVSLFDLYYGQDVEPGKKVVAYRISFQSNEATLTSTQVDKYQDNILRELRRELGAELRG